MSEELTDSERRRRQTRLVSHGISASGFLILLVAFVSTRPHGILVFGLGGLAVAMLVFERTQGAAIGLSLGFLTGSLAVWLWPIVDGGSYFALGVLLITVGIINIVLLPPFYRLGERLADR